MTDEMKESILKIAIRVAREPMRATLDDVRKLARGYAMLATGKVPRISRRV